MNLKVRSIDLCFGIIKKLLHSLVKIQSSWCMYVSIISSLNYFNTLYIKFNRFVMLTVKNFQRVRKSLKVKGSKFPSTIYEFIKCTLKWKDTREISASTDIDENQYGQNKHFYIHHCCCKKVNICVTCR